MQCNIKEGGCGMERGVAPFMVRKSAHHPVESEWDKEGAIRTEMQDQGRELA
jgi:hypothetical protein